MATRPKRPGSKPPDPDDEGPWIDARWALILAAVVLLLVRELVPFGREALYPLTLFATWVHEMGHGLTGLLVGGSFERLDIFWSAAGTAYTSSAPGWPSALGAAGGLLAPPLVGALVLAFARGPKRASIVLWILAATMVLSVPIWVRTMTGWIFVPLVAAGFALLAYRGGETLRHIGAQGIGLVLGLDTISRIDYLFTERVEIDGREMGSDVSHIAEAIGGHYLLWGGLIAVISLGLVALGVRIAWMEEVKLPRPRWPRRGEDVTSSGGGRSNL